MIGRQGLPGYSAFPASLVALLSMAWLSGCASHSSSGSPYDAGLQPAEAYTRLGVAYLAQHSNRRAMQALDHALDLAPNDPEALQAIAIGYQRQGENQLAEQHFQRALEVDSHYTRARNNLAAFLYEQGRIAEACRQLERASTDTDYAGRARLFANLGKCQHELGEIDEARRSLARAQSIDPGLATSYRLLARLEQAQGNHEQAAMQRQRYIQLTGRDPDIGVEHSDGTADIDTGNKEHAALSSHENRSRQTIQGDSE
ncbi:type IV pilus assembly protein PilF [Aidingimonas halophila]|uniref:Type IV pilus assembly protein PilF n=2 Tax=Aidingimonas halophila TaxID=574349 RepID=A0A1H2ZMV5_9GAMM|nr:hypothetical protein GCM10008094_01940 [Aidingimonas halophila]SDX18737.1 type IV pilus assembly protein PilF [Aidingimonas halophila]